MNFPWLWFLAGFRIFHIPFITSKMAKPHWFGGLNFWGQIGLQRQGGQIKKNRDIFSIPQGSVITLGERSIYFFHSRRMPLTRTVPTQTTTWGYKFECLRATVLSLNIDQVAFRLPLTICRWWITSSPLEDPSLVLWAEITFSLVGYGSEQGEVC